MSFLDTTPAAISRGNPGPQWARFRVHNPRQQLATLRDLCRGDTPVVVGIASGPTLQAVLWSVDDVSGQLHFKLDGARGGINALSLDGELWAAAYMDDAKVQFPLGHVTVGIKGDQQLLVSEMPELMYSLPRRQGMRVRRHKRPLARFSHPLAPDVSTELKVLDVSSTGCALLRVAEGLSLPLGMMLKRVEIELDEEIIIFSDLLVHHVTIHSREARSTRVGCTWHGMPKAARDRLHEWIDRGRRRRELMSLSLD